MVKVIFNFHKRLIADILCNESLYCCFGTDKVKLMPQGKQQDERIHTSYMYIGYYRSHTRYSITEIQLPDYS